MSSELCSIAIGETGPAGICFRALPCSEPRSRIPGIWPCSTARICTKPSRMTPCTEPRRPQHRTSRPHLGSPSTSAIMPPPESHYPSWHTTPLSLTRSAKSPLNTPVNFVAEKCQSTYRGTTVPSESFPTTLMGPDWELQRHLAWRAHRGVWKRRNGLSRPGARS